MNGLVLNVGDFHATRRGKKTQVHFIGNGPRWEVGDCLSLCEPTAISCLSDCKTFAQVHYPWAGDFRLRAVPSELLEEILAREDPHEVMPEQFMPWDFARFFVEILDVQVQGVTTYTYKAMNWVEWLALYC